jgi:K+-sensing histidine kinase KdpD
MLEGRDVEAGLRRTARGYALAAGTVATTLVLKAMTPLLGEAHPFVLLPIAIIIPAWYGGIGPGVAASIACVIATDFFFIPPAEFGVDTDTVGLGALLLEGVIISWITDALHRAREAARVHAGAADQARREAALALEMREELLSLWTARLRGPVSDFTTTVEAAWLAHRGGDPVQTGLALEQLHSSAQVMRRTVEHWDDRDRGDRGGEVVAR